MSKPIAVLISDVHYTLKNLELADFAFRAAIDKAALLGLPLIDAGDITNDKAVLRAEIVNRLISTMQYANSKGITPHLMVGNHSLCNEKGSEHSLNFLRPYATIVDHTWNLYLPNAPIEEIILLPYTSSGIEKDLQRCPKGSIVVMHQGFHGADTGDYVHDKSAISSDLVKDFTVISGHYHRHQTIGTVTYIGSPYTQSFGEAKDGPKGYLVLNSDGTYTREILKLRRHRIYEFNNIDHAFEHIAPFGELFADAEDLLWIKITDTKENLDKVKKQDVGDLLGTQNFKLDLIGTEVREEMSQSVPIHSLTDAEILDRVIESSGQNPGTVTRLKALWREL